MKPPSRKRTKPTRIMKAEPAVSLGSGRRASCQWQRADLKKLLNALKRLSKTMQAQGDIDYAFLRTHVPTRSVSEIQSAVESLKNKVISYASFKLQQQRWEEKKTRKPIEVWTHMASAVAGTLEGPISTAFSQMLLVSSTEPRSLRNSDPPQVNRARTLQDRTVPLRPMPQFAVREDPRPGTTTAPPLLVPKTPPATSGPAAKRLAAPYPVGRVPNSTLPPPQQQPATSIASPAATLGQRDVAQTPVVVPSTGPQTMAPVTGKGAPSSNSKSIPSSPHTPIATPSSVASFSPATSSCSPGQTTAPLSNPKYATKDSPGMFGVKCVVDFERIYRYLSAIPNPQTDRPLTPMESAIVLDLLMSLPEEIPKLDCNKLHTHLTQVYKCLSSRADSKMAREMFQDPKHTTCAQTEEASGPACNTTNSQQHIAGTANSGGVTQSGGKKLPPDEAESQSSKSNTTFNQSGHTDLMGLCPPLNPFMVPLKLLTRR